MAGKKNDPKKADTKKRAQTAKEKKAQQQKQKAEKAKKAQNYKFMAGLINQGYKDPKFAELLKEDPAKALRQLESRLKIKMTPELKKAFEQLIQKGLLSELYDALYPCGCF